MTNKDFDNIKQLINLGLSVKQISEITGWSKTTISSVKNFDDVESYREHHKARVAKYRVPTESVETAGETSEKYKMPELERIADALEALVEAFNDTKESGKKKGWLK